MILDTRRLAGFAEAAFCVFALSMFLGAYAGLPLRVEGVSVKGGGTNPYNAAAMALVLVGTVTFLTARWGRLLFVARHGGLINVFILMAAISVLWSTDPWVSGRKVMSLIQTVAFAYYLAASHPVERVIRFTAAALGISMVISAAVAIGIPSVGIMSSPGLAGNWNGVYPHKSGLGAATALSVLFFGWLWRNEPGRRWLHAPMLLLSLFLAIMAHSRTAQVTIGMMVCLVIFLPLLRLPGLARIWAVYGVLLAAFALVTLLYLYFNPVMEALGKDPSLTGRVPTWLGLLDMAWEKPLGGYGYSGFFINALPEIEDVWRRAGWTMWSAHSALIEMMLALGIPGAVVTLWAMLEMLVRSLLLWAGGTHRWASLALVYGVVCLAIAPVESLLFSGGDIHTVLFPLIYVLLRIAGARSAAATRVVAPRSHRPIDPHYGLGRPGADPVARS